ncbi:MAG: radical SAM protein [Candidatus Omnitrophica bacterium]|nr:radical SAM protein [Candidatus Omnitrophota bacterium]
MFLSQPKKFKHIYGPVSSWRLGRSLGVDMLSADKKACTFDCIYCQLGSYAEKTIKRTCYIPTAEIIQEIKNLPRGTKIDYITFSGRGEPALAKNIGETIRAIKKISKKKIAVITNASLMRYKDVRKDLSFADLVVAKMDAYSEKSFRKINKPAKGIKFKDVVGGLKAFGKAHKGRFALQIMFVPQNKKHFKEMAEIAYAIQPDEIEINTPTRPNPIKPLSKDDILKITAYFRALNKKPALKTKIISLYESVRKNASAISREATIKRRGAVK